MASDLHFSNEELVKIAGEGVNWHTLSKKLQVNPVCGHPL